MLLTSIKLNRSYTMTWCYELLKHNMNNYQLQKTKNKGVEHSVQGNDIKHLNLPCIRDSITLLKAMVLWIEKPHASGLEYPAVMLTYLK